jgi:tetratricopeptide (TPR) repeat protein
LDLLRTDLRDLPARQRTIRGAIDWSHDLLDPDLKRFFARLSAFVGGATLDDVEAVFGGLPGPSTDALGSLESLVEHSLVRRLETDDQPSFRMLATVGEYAHERLVESGEDPVVHDAHAAYFLDLAETAAPHLLGAEQSHWLDRLDRDRDNLRAALAHHIARGNAPAALRGCAALWRYWQMRGHLFEGMDRVRAALAIPGIDDHPTELLAALEAAGGIAWWLGDYPTCEDFYQRVLDRRLEGADEAAIAGACYNLSFPVAFNGRPDAGIELATEARDRYARLGDADGVARARWALAVFDISHDDPVSARQEAEAAEAHFRQTDQRFDLAWALFELGQIDLYESDLDGAERHYGEALRMFAEARDIAGIAMLIDPLAAIAYRRGDVRRAATLAGAVARLERAHGAGLIPMNRRRTRSFEPSIMRDDPATAAAWREGEAMAVADAIELALRPTSR